MADRQVVILGAGFGGLYAALHLERALRRERSARIVLLDKGNYHLFVPMLHEITSGGVEPRHVVRPLRPLFRNTRVDFRRAEVRSIDLEGRRILTDQGEVGYDYLVIALGSTTNFFGVDGASETAFTLRSLKDAVGLRNDLLEMFERADLEPGAPPRGRPGSGGRLARRRVGVPAARHASHPWGGSRAEPSLLTASPRGTW